MSIPSAARRAVTVSALTLAFLLSACSGNGAIGGSGSDSVTTQKPAPVSGLPSSPGNTANPATPTDAASLRKQHNDAARRDFPARWEIPEADLWQIVQVTAEAGAAYADMEDGPRDSLLSSVQKHDVSALADRREELSSLVLGVFALLESGAEGSGLPEYLFDQAIGNTLATLIMHEAKADFLLAALQAQKAGTPFPPPEALEKSHSEWLAASEPRDHLIFWHLLAEGARATNQPNPEALADSLLAQFRTGVVSSPARPQRLLLARAIADATRATSYNPSGFLKPPEQQPGWQQVTGGMRYSGGVIRTLQARQIEQDAAHVVQGLLALSPEPANAG